MSRWLMVVALLGPGCKQEEPEPVDTMDTAPLPPQAFTLRFKAVVLGQDFKCNVQYNGLGNTARAVVRFQDLRAFVQNVGFISTTGDTVQAELDALPTQVDGVALLDFETGDNFCEGGTPEVITTITGVVPGGDYTGLAFTLGVPEGLNHRDEQSTTGPLAAAGMWTGPLDGYRFLRVDLTSQGEPDGYPLHVRSAGCRANEAGIVEFCAAPNRVTFTLPGFDPELHTVVMDLGTLAVRNNLDDNARALDDAETSPGCQSEVTDQDCRDFFVSYGLSALPQEWITYAETVGP